MIWPISLPTACFSFPHPHVVHVIVTSLQTEGAIFLGQIELIKNYIMILICIEKYAVLEIF